MCWCPADQVEITQHRLGKQTLPLDDVTKTGCKNTLLRQQTDAEKSGTHQSTVQELSKL